jgi:hypothetical protein
MTPLYLNVLKLILEGIEIDNSLVLEDGAVKLKHLTYTNSILPEEKVIASKLASELENLMLKENS